MKEYVFYFFCISKSTHTIKQPNVTQKTDNALTIKKPKG